MSQLTIINGLKTAVKAGTVTPKQALDQIAEWNEDTPWLNPTRTIGWLKRYKSDDTS